MCSRGSTSEESPGGCNRATHAPAALGGVGGWGFGYAPSAYGASITGGAPDFHRRISLACRSPSPARISKPCCPGVSRSIQLDQRALVRPRTWLEDRLRSTYAGTCTRKSAPVPGAQERGPPACAGGPAGSTRPLQAAMLTRLRKWPSTPGGRTVRSLRSSPGGCSQSLRKSGSLPAAACRSGWRSNRRSQRFSRISMPPRRPEW